ncbi:MAG: site-2 protease family protein [Nibricoccus sp.]
MLKGSIRLFRIGGIELAVHGTFFILLAYVAWMGWREAIAVHEPGYAGALVNSMYVIVFFACVVLHEFGHAFAARYFGIAVPRILLLPIGGMAQMASIPRKPSREFIVAIAGPAVNLAIIVVLLLFDHFPGEQIRWYMRYFFDLRTTGGVVVELSLTQLLIMMNTLMGCFNLIPVFPMDGGRILRALLATRLPYVTATFVAATIAKVFATSGVILSLFWFREPRYLTALLFGFIFFVGEIEYRSLKRREEEDARWRRVLAELRAASPEPPVTPPSVSDRVTGQ